VGALQPPQLALGNPLARGQPVADIPASDLGQERGQGLGTILGLGVDAGRHAGLVSPE